MFCQDKFVEIYKKEPESVSFCPYRVCPIGAHSDHNLGKITGFALDKGIHIAFSPKNNGVVELCSLQFEKRAQWHVRQVPPEKRGDWADYLRGATLLLDELFHLNVGISGVIEGTLPIGGLSSSAAVVLSFLKALCAVNEIKLTPSEMIELSVRVENQYVGVNSGKLDQSCEMYSQKNRLLYLDTQNDTYELIPFGQNKLTDNSKREYDNVLPFNIAIFFSGVERTLAGSKFNMRVDECRSAAYALMAYSGKEYGKFKETNLRSVPREVFEQYKNRLPDTWRLRAEHWYTEFDRVEQGAEAWRNGDIVSYGKLSFESGKSSIYNWDTGSPELKTLYNILCKTDGVYGGRFSGAGFKGCCMALISPDFSEQIEKKVGEEYFKVFPELRGRYSFHICQSADGMNLETF